MNLQSQLLIFIFLVIGIFSISQNSIYGQELKEYESELLGIKLQYLVELDENMQNDHNKAICKYLSRF